MGGGYSTPANAAASGAQSVIHKLDARALTLLSPFEKISLKKNVELVNGSEQTLLTVLGLDSAPGCELILRMAHQVTGSSDMFDHLGLIVCWFSGRLANSLELDKQTYRKQLFLSLAVSEINDEPYVDFSELQLVYNIVLSAFDWDPSDFTKTSIDLLSPSCSMAMLHSIKTPAVLFSTFDAVFSLQPYLLRALANIWTRLLFDKDSVAVPIPIVNPLIVDSCSALPRKNRAMMFATIGPILEKSVSLFEGSKNGYSMKAFEIGVTKWEMPTVLLVKGWQPSNFEHSWRLKHLKIDQVIPHVYDAPLMPAQKKVLRFALFVQDPWRMSSKHCCGDCVPKLIQLEPEYRLWELPRKSVFLKQGTGLGAGLRTAPTLNEVAPGTVFFVDDSMEHAVLRSVPEDEHVKGFEYRFFVDRLEVMGCGTLKDLEIQKKLWEQEDEENHRRTNINVQEDFALLQLDGLTGRY